MATFFDSRDLDVIYEDNHLLAVNKPINVLSQADTTEDCDMISICKEYVKVKYKKPGNVFIGLVHRLDRPVGGAMVFARTSKGASRLSEQVRTRSITKVYRAVVYGKVEKSGTFVDYLYKQKKDNMVMVVEADHRDCKLAELSYKRLEYDKKEDLSLVEISLKTGRPHQIRVQFASRNHPLYGDQRYSNVSVRGEQIALWSHKVGITHPTKKEPMEFVSNVPNKFPWSVFQSI